MFLKLGGPRSPERSSLHAAFLVLARARSTDVDWTGLAPLDFLFPYFLEAGAVFDMSEFRMMPSHLCDGLAS